MDMGRPHIAYQVKFVLVYDSVTAADAADDDVSARNERTRGL